MLVAAARSSIPTRPFKVSRPCRPVLDLHSVRPDRHVLGHERELVWKTVSRSETHRRVATRTLKDAQLEDILFAAALVVTGNAAELLRVLDSVVALAVAGFVNVKHVVAPGGLAIGVDGRKLGLDGLRLGTLVIRALLPSCLLRRLDDLAPELLLHELFVWEPQNRVLIDVKLQQRR